MKKAGLGRVPTRSDARFAESAPGEARDAATKGRKNRALELLTKIVPFLGTAADCFICRNGPEVPHEPECCVPEIEELTGRKSR